MWQSSTVEISFLSRDRSLPEYLARSRNRVTIVLAGSDPDRDYFPRLERARDSFGNESTEDQDAIRTGLTLRVGDVVRFEASGWDPENAELVWHFITPGKSETVRSGTEVTWDWQITTDDVGANTIVWVSITADRGYHKYRDYDGSIGFEYQVLPRYPDLSPCDRHRRNAHPAIKLVRRASGETRDMQRPSIERPKEDGRAGRSQRYGVSAMKDLDQDNTSHGSSRAQGKPGFP